MFRSTLMALMVFAGAQAIAGDKGVTPTEIRLGASAVLSGPLGAQTKEYGVGSRLYFDAVNAAGGVHGRKISYTTLDDGFDVKRAVDNTRKLIEEDGVFLIYNSTGTAQTGAILPLLQETRTIAFGPVTGASAFRDKFNPYLFHVRASYANEARRIISQLKQMGISRIAVFYQDDGLGKTLLAELRQAATLEKMSFVVETKIDPAQPDFKAAATATEKAQPQAVILGTAGTTFTNYVKAVLQTSVKPSFYGFSVASVDVINRELKQDARGIILTQIMPSLRNTTIPAVAEYLKLLREKSPDARPSASQFEGFVHAKLLVEGLRRAGRPLSTDSFIKAMEGAGEISFGRFVAKYSPQSHNGSTYVEMAIIDNEGQLRY
ncbi:MULTISPECIES: ABC transporter substrate-binding protein [unclassified Polaromonas]|uniref:ABC transporter substrate-binding protein n=1 Tax=unclassified Polaromonas TaxID=2638319 RepID=UPI000BD4B8D8|nr:MULTISPECIES: ABC transporter substrate-binding protein [unclassified Polaromonas]OYY38985.1 MAG: branched-chain amino acid ABC transporter substrate-binding protein [Polaromonas sp. 35-63-35]OYZ21850.1 MAG: branched-chain amino acid ABC transporter substrate-binding protein [Polaromonas sp. 16-63-31]OYZ80289.1 MAG: branched-chain amino acid ABC transporter substrate-binding protein [Polaromonas sp. 24-63-21]OZA51351.1 MAG: branched-chain amino acid ABC transporter substrate-binding protein 